MKSDAANYLAISGLQHFFFCQRQWALIHLERQWAENARTFGGRLMHKRADDPFFTEYRGDTLVSRSLPLISNRLQLQGIADVVEFQRLAVGGIPLHSREGLWQPIPVEYKYGQPKPDDTDIVQLTAQALCLEEMFQTAVTAGYIYYGKTRQRVYVEFSEERRMLVQTLCVKMYELLQCGRTPAAEFKKRCKNCSLYHICLPQLAKKKRLLKNYFKDAIALPEER